MPLIKQGVKRGRRNVPIALSAQRGQVFKEHIRMMHVDKTQERIRAAEFQDPRVRVNSSMLATTKENLRKRDIQSKMKRFLVKLRDEVIRKLEGDTSGSSVWMQDV